MCRACVDRVRLAGGDGSACGMCYGKGITDCSMLGACVLECTPRFNARGTAWSCGDYCTAPSLVGTSLLKARACFDCVAGTSQPWNCANCIQVTQGLSDAEAAKTACFDCVQTPGVEPWACGQCAVKPATRRMSCITCLKQNAGHGDANCLDL